MTDIRIGDRRLVEVEVVKIKDDVAGWTHLVKFPDGYCEWLTKHALLASERLPREIKVGDPVRYAHVGNLQGVVKAVVEDRYVVEWINSGNWAIKYRNEIEPALGVSMEGGE